MRIQIALMKWLLCGLCKSPSCRLESELCNDCPWKLNESELNLASGYVELLDKREKQKGKNNEI